jgi:tetratricopeptide (TPR) repeat protein
MGTNAMITRPARCAARILMVILAAGAGCSSTPEFVPPAQPQANIGEQIKTAEALASRAQAAEREKKPDEAIALYRKAVETYRDFPGVWYNLGLLLLDKGETLAAVEAFRASGDLEPRDPRPSYAIGVIYEKQGWNHEAQRYYSEALSRDANYQEALQRSVYLDMIENTSTPVTLERTRRALVAERDPKWRAFFERSQLRLESLLNPSLPDAGAITAPETEPGRRS